MRFVCDIHCHTVASGHAYSTVNENAAWAAQMGLLLIGVSDHAPGMPGAAPLYYFGNLSVLPNEISGVRLLRGAEVNIMGADGTLDLPDDYMKRLDYVIASAHGGCLPYGDVTANTAAFIAAMENPYVRILGHPGDPSFPIDMEKIAEAAKRTGTIIEINNASLIPGAHRYGGEAAIRRLLGYCATLGVPVIAGSDAHVDMHVGRLELAKRLIEESGIDEKLVLNTDVDLLINALAVKRRGK